MWTILAGANIGLINFQLRLIQFLLSKTALEVDKIYLWTYSIQKNLEQLMKALEVEYTEYKSVPQPNHFKELMNSIQKILDILGKFLSENTGFSEYGELREKQLNNQYVFNKGILQGVGEFFTGGFDLIKEKGKTLREFWKLYGIGKDDIAGTREYEETSDTVGAGSIQPEMTAAKMSPEAYADLIVAAIPEAVKRRQEMGAMTAAGKLDGPVPDETGHDNDAAIMASIAALHESVTGMPTTIADATAAAVALRFTGDALIPPGKADSAPLADNVAALNARFDELARVFDEIKAFESNATIYLVGTYDGVGKLLQKGSSGNDYLDYGLSRDNSRS